MIRYNAARLVPRPVPAPPIVVPAPPVAAVPMPHPRRHEQELHDLQLELAALRRRLERLEALDSARTSVRRRSDANVLDIMACYCKALVEAGYTADGRHLTIADLQSIRRNLSLAHPRQVGMWLCVELVRHATVPRVALAFEKDHTTVIAACKKAPAILAKQPRIAAAVNAVRALFDTPEVSTHG